MLGINLALVPYVGLLIGLGVVVGGGVAAFFISITRDPPTTQRERVEEAAKQAAWRATSETIERIFREDPS